VAVRVSCPHCHTVCQVPEEHLASAVRCGQCGKPFQLKTPTSQPAAAEAEEEMMPDWDGLAAAQLLEPGAAKAAAETTLTDPWFVPPVADLSRLDIGAATSAGCVRIRNEDCYLIQRLSWSHLDERRDMALVAVADGLGGHLAGDRASHLVIRTLASALTPLFNGALSGLAANTVAARAEALAAALKEANGAVYRQARADASCRGMAATAAAVLICDGAVQIGHIGDCRVYHYHGGELEQITRDQTLVARMVEMGQLNAEEAATHPARNEVTNALGGHSEIQPAAYEVRLNAGDWLIVACDGLHAHVDATMLREAIHLAVPSAAALAHRLVDMADAGGGSDNTTVVAVRAY